jgi:hypothetical protein
MITKEALAIAIDTMSESSNESDDDYYDEPIKILDELYGKMENDRELNTITRYGVINSEGILMSIRAEPETHHVPDEMGILFTYEDRESPHIDWYLYISEYAENLWLLKHQESIIQAIGSVTEEEDSSYECPRIPKSETLRIVKVTMKVEETTI